MTDPRSDWPRIIEFLELTERIGYDQFFANAHHNRVENNRADPASESLDVRD